MNNHFFDGGFVFYTISERIKEMSNLLEYSILGIATLLMFRIKYSFEELCKIFLGYLIVVSISLLLKEYTIIYTWTWIVLIKQVSNQKVIKAVFYCNLLVILLGVWVTIVGIHKDFDDGYRSFLSVRYTFGFGQPNYTGNLIVVMAMCYVLKSNKTLKNIQYVILLALTVICYVFPNSIGSTIVLLLFTGLIFINERIFKKYNKKSCMLLLYRLAVFLAVLSIFLGMINVARIPVLSKIDKFMSYRYTDIYRTWENLGFSLWGQAVDFDYLNNYIRNAREGHFYVDCSWMYMPMHYGIIFTLFFMYLYFSTMKIYAKRGKVKETIVLFCGTIYAMEQRIFPGVITWIFIIYVAEKIFHKKERKTSGR